MILPGGPDDEDKEIGDAKQGSGFSFVDLAADKAGVPRDTNLASPYNTRIVVGLPPGPIASPGLSALKAVASPANTDYMFLLCYNIRRT